MSEFVGTESPYGNNFRRREVLRALERKIRGIWVNEPALFEAETDPSREPFMATFPYPYMNGRLHLGHAFSMSKADFTIGYQRLQGKNVLFPFGFHVTGMPITAAANKIKNEMQVYGNPPVVPDEEEGEGEAAAEPPAAPSSEASGDITKFKSKKTKTARKTGGVKLQWDILRSMGISDAEIPAFADPYKWCHYFPKLGEEDLKLFGIPTDWRRSFITSADNPFYDQFIRWQFLRLRDNGKIQFGRRATIFAPIDMQACADHDRSAGEGVGPQEYTLIKLRCLELPKDVLQKSPRVAEMLAAGKVFLVAATLRPETMYGQTNCFVLPSGDYGFYEFDVLDRAGSAERTPQILVCAERAARNMSYQDPFTVTADWGKTNLLVTCKGSQLVGVPVKAPKTRYDRVYCLPLLTISMTKGTGVVTSVPSDAPDDYAALRDWQTDDKLRAKHGVTKEMVDGYAVVPIINIPSMGDTSAVFMCDKLGVKTQNDKKKLEEAKDQCYKEGFYKGTMIVGEEDGIKGLKVSEAKDICKAKMCKDGEAFIYYEPEKEVRSRSGDECVVAYLDQWFLAYGEPTWASEVRDHVADPARFETFTKETRKKFLEVVDWLKEWACSRNFGLGTQLPWDEQFVIESLSDSTIYMAYYTIAHLLQGRVSDDDYNGNKGKGSPLGIDPKQLTPEVFDYIFLNKEYPAGCGIDQAKLNKMKESFLYWYPMKLRVSGKDLVQNHLTMSLYNHAAIWKDQPELWPKAFFANGFINVEGKKMAKSEGNFIMLSEAITGHRSFTTVDQGKDKEITVGWTADSTRLALASSGDGLEDANFSCGEADTAILRLTTELEWIEEMMRDLSSGNTASIVEDRAESTFWDRAFQANINLCILKAKEAYEKMRFRDVAKYAFYDFLGARDLYRDSCKKEGSALSWKLVRRFVEVLSIMMSPILTYFTEYLWRFKLNNPGSVKNARWPEQDAPLNIGLVRSVQFVLSTARSVRLKVIDDQKKRAKKNDTKEAESITIIIATEYPDYHKRVLEWLSGIVDPDTMTFSEGVMDQAKDWALADPVCKSELKNCLKCAAQAVAAVAETSSLEPLETQTCFNQREILETLREYATKAMGVQFTLKEQGATYETPHPATPGSPQFTFP